MLEEVVNFYLSKTKGAKLRVLWAEDVPAGPDDGPQIDVPKVELLLPQGLIMKRNLLIDGKKSRKMPDAYTFWEELGGLLVGKGLTFSSRGHEHDADEKLREMVDWNETYSAGYHRIDNSNNLIMVVQGKYNPGWDDREQ